MTAVRASINDVEGLNMAPDSAMTDKEVCLELYKAYLEDLGRIGGRHETLRQFYLSVISALFVFLALAGGTDALLGKVRGSVLIVVGLVGAMVCVSWLLHMWSFARLFKIKKKTLGELESAFQFSVTPFSRELQLDVDPKFRRPRLTSVDRLMASIFIVLFVALMFFTYGVNP